jgi:hypothetical protein
MTLQDVSWSSLCSYVKGCGQNVYTTFSFSNPLSESEELQSWGRSKVLLSFLMLFDCHLWPNQQQQQCLPQLQSILDGHINRHLLPAPFHFAIENTTYKPLIGSEPHCHKPLTPILVFLSQIDRLWIKTVLQLSVNFRHPRRIQKSEFTTRNLSKINKWYAMCERMLFDST